jgi:hypothetical protein
MGFYFVETNFLYSFFISFQNPSTGFCAFVSICDALKGFQSICFPDAGCLQEWQQKAAILQKAGFKIRVSDIVEQNATEKDLRNGWDIADYFLARKDELELNKSEKLVAQMVEANSTLLKLMFFALTYYPGDKSKSSVFLKSGFKMVSKRF